MKIKEFLNIKELAGFAEYVEELDAVTDKLKKNMEDNITACLADIDPDVLKARINLVMQQAFLQSWAVMKLNVVALASQHPDEDIEFLLDKMIEIIENYTEIMAMNSSLAETDVALAEYHFDESLDELEDE